MDKHKPEYIKILNDNAREIIKWLKEHNFKLGIASSSSDEEIDRMLTETGLTNYFDYVLSGKCFKQSKPCPDIYNAMVDMLEVEKEKCLIIEDSYYGIQAAINANIDVVALKDNKLGVNQTNGRIFINGQEVGQVERWLNRRAQLSCGEGYVADNNRFGASDAAAVRAVQQQAGLQPVNGIVYRETWHALQAQCTDPCGREKEE